LISRSTSYRGPTPIPTDLSLNFALEEDDRPSLARIPAMSWTDLGAQFCLVLGFGVLFALAFVPPAPVGKPFYRLMAGTAALSFAVGTSLLPLAGEREWLDPSLTYGWVATAAALACMRQALGFSWWAAMGVGLAASGCATSLALHAGAWQNTDGLLTLTALTTGTVAGSVGLAMVLGHWYLTVPKLDVRHLIRLNRVCMGCMALSLLMVTITCFAYQREISAADARPLFGSWGLFFLGTRLVVGAVLPLIFAWMVNSTLKLGNTRSATGILYASTVLVLIGAAISLSLQETYGVPL